ncbi:MAG: hypothetical protein KC502_20435 [Myxococcales bacterium]|nr:hypothetical protein [Myxococcales bacterium]
MENPSIGRRRVVVGLLLCMAAVSASGCRSGDALPSAQDAVAVMRLIRDMGFVGAELEKRPEFWARSADQPLTYDERAWLLPLFASFVDQDLALDSYAQRFLHQQGQRGQGRELAMVRAVGLGSFAKQLRERLRLFALVGDTTSIFTALDEGSPEHGIAKGQLTRMAIETARPDTILQLDLGVSALEKSKSNLPALGNEPPNLNAAWQLLAKKKRADKLGKELPAELQAQLKNLAVDPLLTTVTNKALAAAKAARVAYRKTGGKLFRHMVGAMIGNEVGGVLDPMVKDIALWMGDTRLRSGGRHLITEAQLDEVQKELEPGDIILERRNWYLSNLGLPGFWPHAALYLGSPDELSKWADDEEVRKLFSKGLVAHIKEASPAAYAVYAADHDGQANRIIEAVSEGVIFATMHHSCLADHVAFLRPRRTKAERAWAVAESFRHYGKPYDFDFDFQTIQSLVCSELVYTAYNLPQSVGRSLKFDPLPSVIGIITLPPNDMISNFDANFGEADSQFDFVAFLDGNEATGTAVRATSDDLRKSWLRAKWDLNQ